MENLQQSTRLILKAEIINPTVETHGHTSVLPLFMLHKANGRQLKVSDYYVCENKQFTVTPARKQFVDQVLTMYVIYEA